jgi:hypothetical protein
VLDRVGQQVAARLRQPQAIAAHGGVRRTPIEPELPSTGVSHGPPDGDGVPQHFGDGHRLEPIAGTAPGPCRMQVVQREPGAPQLEVDRREPLGRRASSASHEVEAEPRGGERAAQLMRCARDQLHTAPELALGEHAGAERRERQPPPQPRQTRAHAAAKPSISR